LIKQFGTIVDGVTIGREVVEDIKTGLKASAAEEARFHRDTLETITKRIEAVQGRLEKAFEAKLEGTVPEELWRKKSQEWQLELQQLHETLAQHQGAKQTFYEQGFKLLELAERAYLLYQKQDRAQMRALVQILCSISVLGDSTIKAAYRQPFDRLVLEKKHAAASLVEGGGHTPVGEKWWSLGESNS
jgi:site-specific DNA recombinase